LLKAYFLAHYTSLEGGATKPIKSRPAPKDPLFNMLSLGFKSTDNGNSSFTKTLKEEFKQYHVAYMFFMVENYDRHFTNNFLVFNSYDTDVLKTW